MQAGRAPGFSPLLEGEEPSSRPGVDWVNASFIVGGHLVALGALIYVLAMPVSWWSVALGPIFFVACGIGVTAGYHRLFAHRAYQARAPLRFLLLLFGAGSVQNSALKWSSDHRRHHAHTDTDEDPYNIRRGLLWAHIGWVFFKGRGVDERTVRDLRSDKLVVWQDRYYVPLAVFTVLVLPFCLGLLWGDPVGAMLIGGVIRLVVQWHATFAINSVAHAFGTRPYDPESTARDSVLMAIASLGEGYHNFHHRYPSD